MNVLPCPFCGGSDVEVYPDYPVYVKCDICGCCGPCAGGSWNKRMFAKAVELWNRRATPDAEGPIVTQDGHGRALRPDENMIEAQLRGEGPFLRLPPEPLTPKVQRLA